MPNAHRQARRFLARIILLVTVFGIAANVVVAWCFAVLIDVEEAATLAHAITVSDRETWRVFLLTRVGAVRVLSQRYFVGRGSSSKTQPSALVPAWVDFDRPTPEWDVRTAPFESRMADARGWPLPSLWSLTEKAHSLHESVYGGVVIRGRILPLRPLWPGCLLDSVLYTFAAALPLARFTIRRSCRLWQYRCMKCGYPIGVSIRCTECGQLLDRQTTPQFAATACTSTLLFPWVALWLVSHHGGWATYFAVAVIAVPDAVMPVATTYVAPPQQDVLSADTAQESGPVSTSSPTSWVAVCSQPSRSMPTCSLGAPPLPQAHHVLHRLVRPNQSLSAGGGPGRPSHGGGTRGAFSLGSSCQLFLWPFPSLRSSLGISCFALVSQRSVPATHFGICSWPSF